MATDPAAPVAALSDALGAPFSGAAGPASTDGPLLPPATLGRPITVAARKRASWLAKIVAALNSSMASIWSYAIGCSGTHRVVDATGQNRDQRERTGGRGSGGVGVGGGVKCVWVCVCVCVCVWR